MLHSKVNTITTEEKDGYHINPREKMKWNQKPWMAMMPPLWVRIVAVGQRNQHGDTRGRVGIDGNGVGTGYINFESSWSCRQCHSLVRISSHGDGAGGELAR